ncbi:MAG: hypothetical protein WCO90_11650, partial [Planctomycetota bacterium]
MANRIRTAETTDRAAQESSVSRKTVAEVPLAELSFELWVHGKPNEMSATMLIALWSTVHVGLTRFRELAPANAAKAAENLKPTV